MTQQEKEAKLKDLNAESIKTLNSISKIISKGQSKYAKTNMRRTFRVFALSLKMRNLYSETARVLSEPILKEEFQSGGKNVLIGSDSEEITKGSYLNTIPKQKKSVCKYNPTAHLKK